jgi:CheY-like chemotaxis protein
MADSEGTFEVGEDAVYALTDRGGAELREAGTSLSAAQLELLVLVDGKATVAQIVRSAKDQSPEAVRATLAEYYLGGLIDLASRVGADSIDAGDFFSVTQPLTISAGGSAEKIQEARDGVKSLNDKGYFVRIVRRARVRRVLPAGRKPTMLVIDDDTVLVKLLNTVFKLEGFAIRSAGNRDGIITAFREPIAPDLVLLDIVMPDIDGFEVLGRLRTHPHPTLKSVPVIMLTAKATRESVLKGLQLGADGYITKPFEIEVLMAAVKTVLRPAGEGREAWPNSDGSIRNE